MLGDITNEIINLIYIETKKKKNKKKIKTVIDSFFDVVFSDIKPYLYTILGILVLIFLINVFQFYYYIKMFINNNGNIIDLQTNVV